MNIEEFISKYSDIITVHFNFELLATDQTIVIEETDMNLLEFLEFYVPRYEKDGHWDDRPIEQIIGDGNSTLVQLKDVISSPTEWGLKPFTDAKKIVKKLWPIPIVSDSSLGRTLVLDSNHTLCTLILAGLNCKVRCVELKGENLSSLGTDLRLMRS